MKRSIAFILALILAAAMSATVFAIETNEDSQDVLASYEEGDQDKTVISVDINWNQMSFTYKGESEPVWNAENHRYEGETTEAGWMPGAGSITIRNHSNAILQAKISYEQETAYDTVSMKFTDEAPYVGSAYTDDNVDEEGKTHGTPCQITVKAIPVGTLDKETKDNTKIGTIKIVLAETENVYAMLDLLMDGITEHKKVDTTAMDRGVVYFAPGTNANDLTSLMTAASAAYADQNLTPAEKNVAINKALTAYYGALDIAQ